MKKYSLIILLLFLISTVYAQTHARRNHVVEDSFSRFLTKKIFKGSNLNYDTLFSSPKNQVQLFMFAASFNNEGRIDSVYFPRELSSRLLTIIHSKAALSHCIIKEGFIDKSLSGKVIIQPVLMRKAGDDSVELDPDFMKGFSELWPELNEYAQAKPIVLKKPYLLVYFPPVH